MPLMFVKYSHSLYGSLHFKISIQSLVMRCGVAFESNLVLDHDTMQLYNWICYFYNCILILILITPCLQARAYASIITFHLHFTHIFFFFSNLYPNSYLKHNLMNQETLQALISSFMQQSNFQLEIKMIEIKQYMQY